MLNRHNSSLSALIKHDTEYIDLVQSVMNYSVTVNLEYGVQFLHFRASDIARDMQPSLFMQDKSTSHAVPTPSSQRYSSKNRNVFTLATEKSKQSSVGHEQGLVNLNDASLFSSNEEDDRLLVRAADSRVNSPIHSASFHAQLLSHFGMKMLFSYRNLQNRMNRWKCIVGAEPVSFYEFLNFKLKITVRRIYQGLIVR